MFLATEGSGVVEDDTFVLSLLRALVGLAVVDAIGACTIVHFIVVAALAKRTIAWNA